MIRIGDDDYLSAPEAAELLGVKVSTLYAYASRGRIRSYRQGRKRRRLYRRAELEALLELQGGRVETMLPRAEDWVPYT